MINLPPPFAFFHLLGKRGRRGEKKRRGLPSTQPRNNLHIPYMHTVPSPPSSSLRGLPASLRSAPRERLVSLGWLTLAVRASRGLQRVWACCSPLILTVFYFLYLHFFMSEKRSHYIHEQATINLLKTDVVGTYWLANGKLNLFCLNTLKSCCW